MMAVSKTFSAITLFAALGKIHFSKTATAPSHILMLAEPCGKPQRGTRQLFSIENKDRLHAFGPQAIGIPLFEHISSLPGTIVFVQLVPEFGQLVKRFSVGITLTLVEKVCLQEGEQGVFVFFLLQKAAPQRVVCPGVQFNLVRFRLFNHFFRQFDTPLDFARLAPAGHHTNPGQ
jgi:hypothetical protein